MLAEHEAYMTQAIKLAKKAYVQGDVPIGCVIVKDGTVIARGYNKRNLKKTTLAHAELLAIEQASKKTWRLAVGRMYDVCDIGAMPDVCRGYRSGENSKSRNWMHESESRLCRFHPESV